ncbi:MAG: hypothetical protein V1662_06200 [Candidatus Omnitrophota bacterium]
MKKVGKVIGVIFLLLFFCGYTPSLQSYALAEDSSSPGSQWQEIPAYGPELQTLTDWQGTSSNNTTNTDVEETFYSTSSDTGSATGGIDNMLSGLTGSSGTGGMSNILGAVSGGSGNQFLGILTDTLFAGSPFYYLMGIDKLLGGSTGTPSNSNIGSNDTTTAQNNEDLGLVSVDYCGKHFDDVKEAPLAVQQQVMMYTSMPVDNSGLGFTGPITPGGVLSMGVTADFDPCTPGRETKWYSPLVIDTDKNGVIELSGGTIQFDIAPHLAGLETIPVPAAGKDMFLVWDKAGTETIEGTEREYKEGEIIDITELFGPEDYTRSDFSVLAYTDDGFTKLRKLCDINQDGVVDKQDTALSPEVSAKLKLWSPLSGQLILFKDTNIVIDVRAGSYERHPSDVQGWAVEYKMKDTQDRLVGYQWLTSKTSSPLCVDALLAIQ